MWTTTHAAGLLAACVCAVAAGPASAQDIRINRVDCGHGVHLVARNARAADVLKALAAALDFRVSIEDRIDSVVNIDSIVSLTDLVPRLLPGRNLIVSHRDDPRCPGNYRPARVWVLAAGPAPYRAAISSAPLTPEAQEQDELYQRAHGMLPPLEEGAPSQPR